MAIQKPASIISRLIWVIPPHFWRTFSQMARRALEREISLVILSTRLCLTHPLAQLLPRDLTFFPIATSLLLPLQEGSALWAAEPPARAMVFQLFLERLIRPRW